jgi:hypothetical protein
MATSTAQQQAPLPGQYFDTPGIAGGSTQWTEQDDASTDVVTAQSASAQVPIQGIQQYRQTDVVTDWTMCLAFTSQSYAAGTGQTLTASAYAPMNAVGPVKQIIQNQYSSVDVESGIDLYIFNLMRPYRSASGFSGGTPLNLYANPAGDPVGGTATGFLTTGLAQANQINSAIWSTSVTAYNLLLRLPAAQWFDKYYDLAVTGEPLTMPHPALVSPQYMAGTTRVITPQIFLNQGLGAGTDTAPVATTTLTPTSDTASTFSGTATLRLRRRAAYAGNPAILPPVYAWQYRWKTQRFSIAGVSQANLIVPLDTGQLLSLYVRMFDPSAASGIGAPININTLTRVNLQYGAGLYYFDAQTIGGTTAAELLQKLWLDQHGNLLPQGVVAYDLAIDERGNMTNARCLNTLSTAGILAHLEFTSALSSTAYAVLGTESLVYVT